MSDHPSAPTPTSFRIERVRSDGADLHVEVRGAGRPIVLHGAPMGASAFEEAAALLSTDHTVVTIDPRGIARSDVDDRTAIVDPDTRAGDVAHVLTQLDLAPAVVFGSSGGAVSALSLVASRPDLVSAAIAHEPPLAALLDEHEQVRADTEAMIATYRSGDRVGYWRQFLASAGIDVPAEVFEAWFSHPPEGRDADDERFGVEQMELATTCWDPPIARLLATGRPIIVGIGSESVGQFCDRTSRALAARLDVAPVIFPGDHTGFIDHPRDFVEILRAAATSVTTTATGFEGQTR